MSRAARLAALRQRIRQIEGPARHGVLPFGVDAIDRALPQGGLALGALHEIIGAAGDEEDGAAASGFAAGILARLGAGLVLWCLRGPDLYGPGLLAHGLDPARLVLAMARRDEEILWAVEEGLRESRLAAVVGEVGRLPMVAGRRLQLAAERSGTTALILRRWRNAAEAAVERERPGAAVTRWRVAVLPSADIAPTLPFPASGGGLGRGVGRARWRVALLRVRGGVPGAWDVEVADATGHVSLSAGLAARPAAPSRQETGQYGAAPRLRHAG
jgi:protein ImuA